MSFRLFLLYAIVQALLCNTPIHAQDRSAADSSVREPHSSAVDSASVNDTLRARIAQWSRYASRRGASPLYLQTDKDIYIPNSNLLFTGYLFQGDRDTSHLHILYVELVDPAKKRTVAADRFLMKDLVGSGSLFLPDTLAPGPYLLIAYTNALLEGKAQEPVRKLIHIRSSERAPFTLTVSPVTQTDQAHGDSPPDSLRLKCRITTQYGGVASGGLFSYNLSTVRGVLQSGSKKIDAFGELILALPAADSLLTEVLLTAQVKRNDVSANFWRPVTLTAQRWNIRYYPEGGHLINGYTSRMGVEIRNAEGKGISTHGILTENGQPLTSFDTDGWGRGELTFIPDEHKRYSVKIAEPATAVPLNGDFPEIRQEGYAMSIPSAIVQDSLTVQIHSPQPGSTFLLMVYNDQAIYYASAFRLRSNEGTIRLPADSLIKGLAAVTLYDDKGFPVAERAVYFPGQPLTVSVTPDSSDYQMGSKITLRIAVTDAQGRGVPSLFSLATVLSSRRAAPETTNSIIDLEVADSITDLDLLTRPWKPYHWTEIASDTLPIPTSPPPTDYGYVLYRNKRPGRSLDLLLMGPGPLRAVSTDSRGDFQLPDSMLITPQYGHSLLAVAEQNDHDQYELRVQNDYDSVNDALARAWFYPPPEQEKTKGLSQTFETIPDDKEFNSLKTLKTIVIEGGGDHYAGDATCNDYVCPYNVLNCMNHPYGRRPEIGQTYLYTDYLGGPFYKTVYRGCVSARTASRFLKEVRGIHLTKDIYKPDDKGNNAPGLETPYNSTLFWSPLSATDKDGEATLIFYSQQLPGGFINILQGLSTKGTIQGKSTFQIVSPLN